MMWVRLERERCARRLTPSPLPHGAEDLGLTQITRLKPAKTDEYRVNYRVQPRLGGLCGSARGL